MAQSPNPVILSLEGIEPQRRLTVAFRLVLAIPHFFYASLVGFAATLAVVVGWVAALVIARLPGGIAIFVGRALQYYSRVQAYALMLLTDRYPPFALTADYPVSVEVAPGRLNRAAVLFRLVLMIPAYFVVWILGTGHFVVSLFVWLIVLITGRLPNALFQANAAILRYQVRFYAYGAMLTSEYPRGLFGDGTETDVAVVPPPPLPPSAPAPPPPPPKSPRPLVAETRRSRVSAPESESASPHPGTPPPPRPRFTRLVLSRAAKRIVVLVLVLGAIVGIGSTVASAITAVQSSATMRELGRNHEEILAGSQQYQIDTQNCAATEGGLPCLQQANQRFAEAFAEFNARLREQSFPAYSLDAARRLESAAVRAEESLRALSAVSTATEYQSRAPEVQQAVNEFDQAFVDLASTLP